MHWSRRPEMRDLRMACRRDEVEQSMHPVVAETRVTLDTRLLGQDVIVLAFEVAHDLLESVRNSIYISCVRVYGAQHGASRELVVDVVTKAGRVHDGEGNADAVLLQFCSCAEHAHREAQSGARTDVDGFDPDALLDVRRVRAVRHLVGEDFGLAECVHEGRTSSTRGTCNNNSEATARVQRVVALSGTRQCERWHGKRVVGAKLLTDDHDGELDTLLDLVSSASAGERHGVRSVLCVGVNCFRRWRRCTTG